MIGSELVAELDESSYNLNTSPFTVSNLQGDLYDYHFFAFCDSGSTTDGDLEVTLNSDTGTNYSRYLMQGSGAGKGAATYSENKIRIINITRNISGRNSLAMSSLTGSSGSNRKMTSLYGTGYYPNINVQDAYWTNTVDEVTSITFTGSTSASYKWHIAVYRTPKESVQGTWEYMKELNWSSESTEKSFTGLDGDLHKQYKIVFDLNQIIDVELNNDNGSNYVNQDLYNNSGSISAFNSTGAFIRAYGISEYIINAESGVDRLVHIRDTDSSASDQLARANWWQNTADNLTSIYIQPQASATATGTAKLYRRINPTHTADVLPFETIKTFDVSGDYSAGDTLSGLTCDDYKLIKIEWLGSGSPKLEVQFNSDTGTNYYQQSLRGNNSTASAAAASADHHTLKASGDAGEQSLGEIYLYPKSGEYRPSLAKTLLDEDDIRFYGNWWQNSADEITSIKVYASTTSTMSGQIKISVLR